MVLCGPGGVGKGTVAHGVVERLPWVVLSRSWTTRAPRVGEDKCAYVFVDRERFRAAIDQGEFLEWASFNGELYGTPQPAQREGAVYLLEIDLQGARSIRELDTGALIIALEPPSTDELVQRMRRRGDAEDDIRARVAIGEDEISQARAIADVVIVNEQVERAIDDVAGAVVDWVRGAASTSG
ncbi:MAG: guanylate kinase [Ferrimicrobium sp.]